MSAPEAASGTYWLVPVADRPSLSAIECLKFWLDQDMWGVYSRSYARVAISRRDWLAFYGARAGVLAYAQVVGPADRLLDVSHWPEPTKPRADVYRLPVGHVVWLDRPLDIRPLIPQLTAFRDRSPSAIRNWAWFVQATRRIHEHDFSLLTMRGLAEPEDPT